PNLEQIPEPRIDGREHIDEQRQVRDDLATALQRTQHMEHNGLVALAAAGNTFQSVDHDPSLVKGMSCSTKRMPMAAVMIPQAVPTPSKPKMLRTSEGSEPQADTCEVSALTSMDCIALTAIFRPCSKTQQKPSVSTSHRALKIAIHRLSN